MSDAFRTRLAGSLRIVFIACSGLGGLAGLVFAVAVGYLAWSIHRIAPGLGALLSQGVSRDEMRLALMFEALSIPSVQRALIASTLGLFSACVFASLSFAGLARLTRIGAANRRPWLVRVPFWVAGCIACLFVADTNLRKIDWGGFIGSDAFTDGPSAPAGDHPRDPGEP